MVVGKDKVKGKRHENALSIVEQRTGRKIRDQAIQSGTHGMQLGENQYTYLREIGGGIGCFVALLREAG